MGEGEGLPQLSEDHSLEDTNWALYNIHNPYRYLSTLVGHDGTSHPYFLYRSTRLARPGTSSRLEVPIHYTGNRGALTLCRHFNFLCSTTQRTKPSVSLDFRTYTLPCMCSCPSEDPIRLPVHLTSQFLEVSSPQDRKSRH